MVARRDHQSFSSRQRHQQVRVPSSPSSRATTRPRAFVAWWQANVTPGRDKGLNPVVAERKQLESAIPARDATAQTAVSNRAGRLGGWQANVTPGRDEAGPGRGKKGVAERKHLLAADATAQTAVSNRAFVGWWQANVTPGHGGDRKSKDQGFKTATLIPARDATAQTGVSNRALAMVMGVSHTQINDDLSGRNLPPTPENPGKNNAAENGGGKICRPPSHPARTWRARRRRPASGKRR